MLAVTRTVLALGAVVLAAAPLRAQRRSNVITAEEVERAQPNVGTAYDAVQRLRPRWLARPREVMHLPGPATTSSWRSCTSIWTTSTWAAWII